MEYQIIYDKNQFSKVKSLFLRVYSDYCGEFVEQYFERMVQSSDRITAFVQNGSVVAFAAHQILRNINSGAAPEYLRDCPPAFIQSLHGKTLLTSEWLTIVPESLGQFSKVHPLDLLLGICLRMTFQGPTATTFDGAMGYSRQDRKVDRMAQRFGAELMGTVYRFQIPCSIVFCQPGALQDHPISRVQQKIETLWNQREIIHPPFEKEGVA